MDEHDVAEVQPWIERESAERDPLGLPELRVPGRAAFGRQISGQQYCDTGKREHQRRDPGADRAPGMAAAGAGETLGHVFEFFASGRTAQPLVRGTACGAGWRTRGLRPCV